MSEVLNIVLITLYVIGIVCSMYIICSHWTYFEGRLKAGVVNMFMLAVLFFLVTNTLKMLDILYAWIGYVLHWDGIHHALQLYLWTVGQIGTTIALIILTILTYTKKYDWFVFLQRKDRKAVITQEPETNNEEGI